MNREQCVRIALLDRQQHHAASPKKTSPAEISRRLPSVSLNFSAPEGTERPATALAHHLGGEVASPPTVEAAAAKLAEAFDVWMGRWETLGFEPILDAWRTRTTGLDGPAVARLGRETVEGCAEGVAADGALKLRLTDGSLRLISAGDVFFGEAA